MNVAADWHLPKIKINKFTFRLRTIMHQSNIGKGFLLTTTTCLVSETYFSSLTALLRILEGSKSACNKVWRST